MSTDTSSPNSAPENKKSAGGFRQYDTPVVILVLLFGVMAIFGLPLLWASKAFSPLMKVLLSVVVTLYTLAILYAFYLIMAWCYTRIMHSLHDSL